MKKYLFFYMVFGLQFIVVLNVSAADVHDTASHIATQYIKNNPVVDMTKVAVFNAECKGGKYKNPYTDRYAITIRLINKYKKKFQKDGFTDKEILIIFLDASSQVGRFVNGYAKGFSQNIICPSN